jgi:hypothetical protein
VTARRPDLTASESDERVTLHGVEVLESSSLFRRANSQRLRSQEVTECERIADTPSVVHCSPSAKRPFVPPAHKMIEFELENWRRRPDLNRGWRFCRAVPGLFSRSPLSKIGSETTPTQSDTQPAPSPLSCVALVEIGSLWFAAGTLRAQPNRQIHRSKVFRRATSRIFRSKSSMNSGYLSASSTLTTST